MKLKLFFLILILIGHATACTQSVKENRFTAESPRFEMLIAGDTSEFKDGIRSRLIETYRGQGNISLMGIDKLNEVKISDFDVILIMDTCLAWTHFNPSLMAYLDRNQDLDKLVLFFTAGDPDWEFSYHGIDAVTSASQIENEDQIVNQLTQQINGILATMN